MCSCICLQLDTKLKSWFTCTKLSLLSLHVNKETLWGTNLFHESSLVGYMMCMMCFFDRVSSIKIFIPNQIIFHILIQIDFFSREIQIDVSQKNHYILLNSSPKWKYFYATSNPRRLNLHSHSTCLLQLHVLTDR